MPDTPSQVIRAKELSAAYKIADRAVVCPLLLGRKKACRQLVVLPVIMQAFTAFSLPAAWLIGAVAMRVVIFHSAFHSRFLLEFFY
jgi:hypothetical protein